MWFEKVPVPKALATLAVPTIVSQLITMIYNLSDTYFIGKTNNPYQIAAASLAYVLVFVMTALSNLFGVGGGSLIFRLLGGQKEEEAKSVCAFSFYGAIAISLIYSLGCYLFMDPLLRLLGASENTYSYTASYLKWTVVIGGIPTVISLVLGHLVRAEGNTKQASIGMSIGGILNIFLDPVLISWVGLGITGAAIATAFSNGIAMLYFFSVLWRNRKKSVLTLYAKNGALDTNTLAHIVLIGFPAALVVLLGSTANIVLAHSDSPQSSRGTLRTCMVPAHPRQQFPDSGHCPLPDTAAKKRFRSKIG